MCQLFKADYCQIVLFDQSKRYSCLRCQISGKKRFVSDKREKIVNAIEKKVLRDLSSTKKDDLLVSPLICEDVIGLIIIRRRAGPYAFTDFDQEALMAVLEQAVIGIKNLQLYDEQQRIILGSIKSLVTLLDTRVPQEYTHSPYFSRLVGAIGRQLHLDEKQIESLKFASLLHDTGKIDIPIEILTKQTKLTRGEFNIIKTHPAKGVRILQHLQILKPVIPIIMHHHEKYDGTGYPSRLKKGQIPQGARIMAVADAFEAMVYGRPYRERMNVEQAIREIRKKSGRQFDPKVVEAFLKVAKRITKKYL
jgi:HD-GYP domain-containing protein (c-di-GMP phosphodiesterase class II)